MSIIATPLQGRDVGYFWLTGVERVLSVRLYLNSRHQNGQKIAAVDRLTNAKHLNYIVDIRVMSIKLL